MVYRPQLYEGPESSNMHNILGIRVYISTYIRKHSRCGGGSYKSSQIYKSGGIRERCKFTRRSYVDLNQYLFFLPQMDHALHVAIREHSTQCALMLLDYGAPIDVENAKKVTPLILSAQKGNVTLVRELLGRGANIATETLTGLTAILQAAHFGKTSVLKLLLQSCSTHLIECANYNQTTALMRASQEGHVQTVQLLLEAGAQVCSSLYFSESISLRSNCFALSRSIDEIART